MRKKLALLMASLFLIVGTAWAQTPVLKLMSGQIGNSYPFALSDEDASKVFALEDLTVAVKVNASTFTHNARMALFCTSDPNKNVNIDGLGKNSHYVAYGLSGTSDNPAKGAVGYLASCKTGDRFTKGGVDANSQEVVLVYVINPSDKTYKMYINGVENGSWVNAHTDGFMSGYEIATPKMVKADYSDAKIYIGGGVKADNSSFETFNGTITGVEVYEGALTAEQVKNVFLPVTGKVYQIKNLHDSYHVYDAGTALKPVAPANVDINNKSQLWVLGKSATAGKYTLRNAGTKGYMKPGDTWTTSKELTDLYIVENTLSGVTPYFNISSVADAAGNTNLHCWSNTANAINYAGNGGGSKFAFVVTNVTVAELATLAITNELNPLITEANTLKSNTALTGTAELTALTTALTTANGLTSSQDWDAVLASVDALTVAIQEANAYIEANPSGPEATDLYALKSPTGTYFSFTAPTDGTSSAASFHTTPTYFKKAGSGTGYTFEDYETQGRFIGLNGGWNVGTTSAVWDISAEDAKGYVTISRNSGTGNLGHDDNTNAGTGIFTNVGSNCNKWQLIPAYPITIVYKNGEEVIRTVKAAAMTGESYAFDIDLNGGTLVSCTTDKGTATVENNRCTIAAVNGATTVTVTLTLPTAPFAPEVGKAYVLKVVGTDKYLDIRTLGNDDPNASGSNNISTSTKPYPIYFEQGQNGTWKMKNANGKYVGLYPDKAWDPVIGASSHDWTMEGNASNFTIARGSGKYINYNTDADADKVAGKPLYCDKGTGLQFQLVDYNDVDFITGAGLGKEGAESPYVSIKEIDAEGTTTSIPTGMGWVLTIEVENPNGASHGQWGSSILATGKEPFPYKDKHNGFQLYLQSGTNGAKKLDVVFGNADHIVDNVSYIGDFSAVISYDGTGNLQVKTTNANGNEDTKNYDVTLPEISEFAYGLPTGINIKRLAIETIDREYTFAIGKTPNDQEVAVTYNGEALAVGEKIAESKLNLNLFAATEIEGYTWNVIADKETNTITLNYTTAEVLDLQAVKDLVNRIGGEGTADKFKFVHAPWLNSNQETFVLGSEEGKILIKGTTISAITTGLGWYLNNVAKINIAWNSLNEKTVSGEAYADLSNLPLPAGEDTHTSDAKYRYYLNTCTFGYSMTSWTWKRWQQEIDWMALHGINMPLQLVGMEEVWRKFLTMEDGSGNRKYGYTDEEAKAFVAGPAFIPWWAMNNLQGWGGTGEGAITNNGKTWKGAGGVQDNAWYTRQKNLAKQIVDRQRELGMQPVLPGWSGMVPTDFANQSGYATRGNGGNWVNIFPRPLLLSVSNENYADIAADYYACLEEVMGESQYYSMDPFHEGGGAGTMEDYEALYAAMETAKPGSQWVIQQWQWSATQKYSLTAVPAGRLIVLDLFSDGSPAFDGYKGYAPQDAVFCAIPNFGGRSGLMGRLQNVTDNYFKFKGKYASIKGIGTAPEAIEQTPVTYDLIYQLPWMNGQKPNVAEWVDNYAVARYGKDNAVVKEAWSLLRQGPLNYGADGIQGPVEDVWAARPNLIAKEASAWGATISRNWNGTIVAGNTYTKERRQMLIDATYKLLSQQDELNLTAGSVYESNYNYDLVEFGGGVMADYAHDLLKGIASAKGSDNALYEARKNAFLALIEDVDAFKGTNLNFRLGKWTQEARDAAGEVEGASTATPDWYEYNNARTILSTWAYPNTQLNDYSYRSWQGLMKDLYLPRWKHYFENNCTTAEYGYFEWNWAHGMTHQVGETQISTTPLAKGQPGHTDSYTREPEGNTVELAKSMLAKYIIPVKYNDGSTYYAYRTFTTDLAGKATVYTTSGSSVDFTKFFNVPADAVVTGDFINNNEQSANIKAVPTVGAEGTYTGTITIADGTELQNFTVVLTAPQLNGYYNIYYKGTPLFIGYNEVDDDWVEGDDHKGYKILGADVYTTDAVADKIFSIVPQGDGFTITAQGKTLKSPNFDGWNHIQFSDDEDLAGIYKFHKQPDLAYAYKIQGIGENNGDEWTHCDYLEVYTGSIVGNNSETIWDSEKEVSVEKASIFTLTPVTEYTLTVPTSGYAAVCLPFNVVLPEGVEAYDVTTFSEKTPVANLLVKIAGKDNIISAGTPVILKANAGSCVLTITKENTGVITSPDGSLLRGNFVKQTLEIEETKKFILNEAGNFEFVSITSEIPANSCWVVSDIEDENASVKDGQIVIDGWTFEYSENVEGRITLEDVAKDGDVVKEGDGDLVIGSEYTVKGEKKSVVGISPKFLHGNTTLESVTLPATMTNLGFRKIEPMFDGSYAGQPGDNGGTYEGSTAQGEVIGKDRVFEFRTDPVTNAPYEVNGTYAWRLTLDVTIDPAKKTSFNNYGSAIVSSKSNSLADKYDDGYMQIYLWKDLQHLVVKIDNNDDSYSYTLPELDTEGNETGNLVTLNHFKFELEHDGAGGYQVVIYYDDGRAKMYSISAGQSNLKAFSSLWYSLPEGISVDVKFEKLISEGLFVGCTNLKEIKVDPANPTFKSCEHGVLYDKNGYYVMRIPEGGTDHFEIPSKVVKLYAGAVHGVNADIVLHSNPQIGVVEGHEDHVKNAKFYLSLDDKDGTITENETGYGGARDFISTNNNTYLAARYKRAPLRNAEVFGTICLPFAPENATAKYDFFEFTSNNESSLTFTQVTELEANKPYIYRLKATPEEASELSGDKVFGTDESGNDIFETNTSFTVVTKAKYDPNQHEAGTFDALGSFVNYFVETAKYPDSYFYLYQSSTNKFHRVTKILTYRPYRAFFVVTPEEGQAAQAPSLLNLVLLDGTTTSIDASLVEGMEAPEYYDLSGRRVINPVSGGIYIVNGKKVFIK